MQIERTSQLYFPSSSENHTINTQQCHQKTELASYRMSFGASFIASFWFGYKLLH